MSPRALISGALLAALLVVLGAVPVAQAAPLDATALPKYVDLLPVPQVAAPSAPGYYELHMAQGTAQLLPTGWPATPVWGYAVPGAAAGYLGPTIVAESGVPLNVGWYNDLPAHPLGTSIDTTIDGNLTGGEWAASRAVAHLHGGHVEPASDGGPDDWFLPGQSKLDDYPNDQPAATLWYHDHALGITRLNPYLGLAGAYVVTDAHERSLNLPTGAYDIPLVIQDKTFDTSGAQTYATTGILPAIHPTWVPEYFGNAILVNGKVWPYLDVEPRKYRFRMVNGSNARFYDLTLTPSKDQDLLKPLFHQIGAEGGLLPATAPLQRVLIAPGERADVIVDFSRLAGMTVLLKNTAKAPYPAGEAPDPKTTGQVMLFRVVKPLVGADTSTIPDAPQPIEPLLPADAAQTRDIKLSETLDPATGFPTMLMLEDRAWHDPVTIMPKLGTTEVWRFVNTTADTHPMHTHLTQFQVVGRQAFDVPRYLGSGELVFRGKPKGPNANETGWKDTVKVNPGEVVTIIAAFDRLGRYPVHCHILEHEENEMMRPFEIVP